MSCISCSPSKYYILKYVLTAFAPLTIFCLVIVVFHINIHSSYLQGFVLYSQLISSPVMARAVVIYLQQHPSLRTVTYAFGTLFGVWNLDFFRLYSWDICFSVSEVSVLAMDMVVAVYPLLLIATTYSVLLLHDLNIKIIVVVWKPFKYFFYLFDRHWDVKSSMVDAFATFMFLSHGKLLSVCTDLLVPVQVHTADILNLTSTGYSWRLYYSSNVHYFGKQHRPYGHLAVFILIVFLLLPCVGLIVFPLRLFQRVINFLLPNRVLIMLRIFADSYQGCYSNGTCDSGRDCRWFSSIPFLIRIAILLIYSTVKTDSIFLLSAMILTLTAILTLHLEPYRADKSHFATHFISFILFLGIFCMVVYADIIKQSENNSYQEIAIPVVFFVVLVVPIVYIFILTVAWIVHHVKHCAR